MIVLSAFVISHFKGIPLREEHKLLYMRTLLLENTFNEKVIYPTTLYNFLWRIPSGRTLNRSRESLTSVLQASYEANTVFG